MNPLRVFTPNECDSAGIPLDWDRCRQCLGTGVDDARTDLPEGLRAQCLECDGHGSLKTAALAFLRRRQWGIVDWSHKHERTEADVVAGYAQTNTTRCEDCAHPMSDGAWDWVSTKAEYRFAQLSVNREKNLNLAFTALREGREPGLPEAFYSSCDERCRHSGALRFHPTDGSQPWVSDVERNPLAMPSNGTETAGDVVARVDGPVEASWRPVNVRCLSWAHDLRPEQIAVLCLRCFAARSLTSRQH